MTMRKYAHLRGEIRHVENVFAHMNPHVCMKAIPIMSDLDIM